MKFKLIVALVSDSKTERLIKAARLAGATGCTVITGVRGEGLDPPKTFLGLSLEGQINALLFLVEQHLSRTILEVIAEEAEFDQAPGAGIAFQVDIEDAVGLASQMDTIEHEIEDQL